MEKNKTLPWMLPTSLFLAVLLILYVVSSLEAFESFEHKISDLFRPIVVGLILSYICNPLFRLFEMRILSKIRPLGLRRGLSLFLTYLCLAAAISVVLLLIVPQVVNSVLNFLINYESYLDSTVGSTNFVILRINDIFVSNGQRPPLNYLDAEKIRQSIANSLASIHLDSETLSKIISDKENVAQVMNIANGFLSFAKNTLFGFFVSLYLLSSKEKRYAQIMRMRRALFSRATNYHITKICTVSNRAFGRYLGAQLVGSLFVGSLTYCVTAAFNIPYAPLLSFSVGALAFLPLIGPILAVILAIMILVLVEPSKVLPIALILILIFILNKRLIVAKMIPDGGGISPLGIVAAISTVGMVCGLPGLILSVPLFATVAELIDYYAESSLKRKNLSEDTLYPGIEWETDEENAAKGKNSDSVTTSDIFRLAKRYRSHKFRAIPPAEEPAPQTESDSLTDNSIS